MNVQKRPPRIAQSANRAAKLPPQEINARVESKGEAAASDTTEAKSELNTARLALKERAQTPEGRAALANALDGRMASERTTVELLVMEELFLKEMGMLNNVKVVVVPQASVADIKSGKAPATALPKGVDAAYSKNVILVREGLKPAEMKAAVAEELGEHVAKQAEARGVKLAPGDVGARILKVMNGQPLTQADFQAKTSDKAVVRYQGQLVQAQARAVPLRTKGPTSQVVFSSSDQLEIQFKNKSGQWQTLAKKAREVPDANDQVPEQSRAETLNTQGLTAKTKFRVLLTHASDGKQQIVATNDESVKGAKSTFEVRPDSDGTQRIFFNSFGNGDIVDNPTWLKADKQSDVALILRPQLKPEPKPVANAPVVVTPKTPPVTFVKSQVYIPANKGPVTLEGFNAKTGKWVPLAQQGKGGKEVHTLVSIPTTGKDLPKLRLTTAKGTFESDKAGGARIQSKDGRQVIGFETTPTTDAKGNVRGQFDDVVVTIGTNKLLPKPAAPKPKAPTAANLAAALASDATAKDVKDMAASLQVKEAANDIETLQKALGTPDGSLSKAMGAFSQSEGATRLYTRKGPAGTNTRPRVSAMDVVQKINSNAPSVEMTSMTADVSFRPSVAGWRDRLIMERYDDRLGKWVTVADGERKGVQKRNLSIPLVNGEPPRLRLVNYSYGYSNGNDYFRVSGPEDAEKWSSPGTRTPASVKTEIRKYTPKPSEFNSRPSDTGYVKMFTHMKPVREPNGLWKYEFYNSGARAPGEMRQAATKVKFLNQDRTAFLWEDGGNLGRARGAQFDVGVRLKTDYETSTLSKPLAQSFDTSGKFNTTDALRVLKAMNGGKDVTEKHFKAMSDEGLVVAVGDSKWTFSPANMPAPMRARIALNIVATDTMSPEHKDGLLRKITGSGLVDTVKVLHNLVEGGTSFADAFVEPSDSSQYLFHLHPNADSRAALELTSAGKKLKIGELWIKALQPLVKEMQARISRVSSEGAWASFAGRRIDRTNFTGGTVLSRKEIKVSAAASTYISRKSGQSSVQFPQSPLSAVALGKFLKENGISTSVDGKALGAQETAHFLIGLNGGQPVGAEAMSGLETSGVVSLSRRTLTLNPAHLSGEQVVYAAREFHFSGLSSEAKNVAFQRVTGKTYEQILGHLKKNDPENFKNVFSSLTKPQKLAVLGLAGLFGISATAGVVTLVFIGSAGGEPPEDNRPSSIATPPPDQTTETPNWSMVPAPGPRQRIVTLRNPTGGPSLRAQIGNIRTRAGGDSIADIYQRVGTRMIRMQNLVAVKLKGSNTWTISFRIRAAAGGAGSSRETPVDIARREYMTAAIAHYLQAPARGVDVPQYRDRDTEERRRLRELDPRPNLADLDTQAQLQASNQQAIDEIIGARPDVDPNIQLRALNTGAGVAREIDEEKVPYQTMREGNFTAGLNELYVTKVEIKNQLLKLKTETGKKIKALKAKFLTDYKQVWGEGFEGEAELELKALREEVALRKDKKMKAEEKEKRLGPLEAVRNSVRNNVLDFGASTDARNTQYARAFQTAFRRPPTVNERYHAHFDALHQTLERIHFPYGGRIPYDQNNNVLVKAVQDYRIENSRRTGTNVAAARYWDPKTGTDRIIVRESKLDPSQHSEALLREFFVEKGIDSNDVKEMYTEREPCGRGPGMKECRKLLEEHYPTTRIYYSFDYPPVDKPGRQPGNAALLDAVKKLPKRPRDTDTPMPEVEYPSKRPKLPTPTPTASPTPPPAP